ncbi:MAG: DUF6259 domain-containing protein [Planctomycetaceae bacterium]|nr:DUF6259 domain-containing protein [Planctomycetaceae bacterium]
MRTTFFFLLLILLFPVCCFGESVYVELSNVPEDGFIVSPLDMTPAANWLAASNMELSEFYYGEQKIDAIFVPDPGNTPNRGTFVAVLPSDVPRGKPCRLRLENKYGGFELLRKQMAFMRPFTATAASTKITFDKDKQGGLPSTISFANGTTLETMNWLDRLHDPSVGSCNIMSFAHSSPVVIEEKPFLQVVPASTEFMSPDSSRPARVEYQWFIFPQRELIYIIVSMQKIEAREWKEKHLLELHIPDGSFGKWFGDDKSGTFTGTKQSQTFNRFAGFLDDSNNVIAAIAPGTVVYDGLHDFGPYLLPHGSDAWQPWSDTKYRSATWFWIGNAPKPGKTLQAAYETVRAMPQASIVIPEFEQPVKDWKTAALNDLFLSGKIASKQELEQLRIAENLPENWLDYESGGLGMILEITDNQERGMGLRLLSLVDKQTNTVLSARESVPFFTTEVLDTETGKKFTLTSDEGWGKVERDGKVVYLSNPTGLPEAESLKIMIRRADTMQSLMAPLSEKEMYWFWEIKRSWSINEYERYKFRKVSFPQIALRNLGPTMKAFYPHASGVVTQNPVGKELRWQGTYPSGWCSMQFTAAYDETRNVGLYVATHDGGGAVKDIRVNADATSDSLVVRFEHPLTFPEQVRSFLMPFQGDWYDAAQIYRNYVRNSAQWYTQAKLGTDGRTDTPQWMKELCVWAQCSDSPQQMPETMRKFTEAFGVPTAVHWYNWHQNPFDNDYPHFFPAKDGFKEAVAEIQKNGDCYVMPYINGHLWDTRDKGLEDFQFSSVALPATAKKEDGKPYIETYGSKESDGSPVELAAMCPATDVWKDKVAENISRLINECGVAGVYVDQVAAAQPNLCFDKSHGHPLGGGYWWNQAYWDMFGKIRSKLPEDKMLTTECNAEPYINIFDGYLTWHFQYQDQVPAFAAVYGGTVQMFGRAYRGGPSQVLADRMKAAQQLVFGEQIGWFDPRIVDDTRLFPFLREIVQTRYKYRDYFYKGEMIRPPKLLDKIPTVTADWQWYGETPITTDAVLTGAWRKRDEQGKTVSAVFFFVNVSDEPVTSRVAVRLDEIGIESKAFDSPLTFAPGVPLTIELWP